MSRSSFAFLHPLRVRWSECDAQGIVFNVNYFLYFDIAVWEWTRAMGYEWKDAPEFLTVRAEADFRGSAVFDDMVDIGIRCVRIGTKSLEVAAAIFRGETALAEGRLVYVNVLKGTKETAPLDRAYIEKIIRFERIAPERKSL